MTRRAGARELAAATPASRDRTVDLLRVVALGFVILGHFLISGVVVAPDAGRPPPLADVAIVNSLVVMPGARWLTWVFQVMPVFFAVGGFAHAKAWPAMQARGGGYADFASARSVRLLRPTLVFVAVGLVVGGLVDALAPDAPPVVHEVMRIVGQPLWFLGIYLLCVAWAPLLLRLHQRHGLAVLAGLVAAAVIVDVLRLSGLVPGGPSAPLGLLNFAFVWLALHQLGFWWALPPGGRPVPPSALAVGGYGLAALLVALGPYPLSMISLPGEAVSNLTPPSVALLAFGAGQVGLALLLRPWLARWVAPTRRWAAVVAANAVIMTVFLWHLSAIVLANLGLLLAGVPAFPPIGSLAWWLWRLPILAVTGLVLTAIVALSRGAERAAPPPLTPVDRRRHGRDALAALGLALGVVGLMAFALTGFAGVLSPPSVRLLGIPISPGIAAALVTASALLVRWAAGPARAAAVPVRAAGP